MTTYTPLSMEDIQKPLDEYWKEKNPAVSGIFSNRIEDRITIELLLFYKCNMNCSFCWQPHKEDIGFSSVEIWSKVKETKKFIANQTGTNVQLTLFGGELFGDHVPDSMFITYQKIMLDLHEYCLSLGKTIKFCIPTNLVFKRIDRVGDLEIFIKKNNIQYDLEFSYNWQNMHTNKETLRIIKFNEQMFESFITTINVVLSDDLARRFANNEEPDEYFKYLYQKYKVNFIVYFSTRFKELNGQVRDSQIKDYSFKCLDQNILLKAYLYLYKNFPGINCIQSFIASALYPEKTFSLECPNNRLFITPDGSSHYCATYNECKSGKILLEFHKQNNCFNCKYFKSCRAGGECMYEDLDPNIIKPKDGCLYYLLYEEIRRDYQLS